MEGDGGTGTHYGFTSSSSTSAPPPTVCQKGCGELGNATEDEAADMPHVQPEALLERRRPSPMHRQWTRERLPMLRTAGRVPPGGLETPPPAAPPAARHGTTARWKIPGTTPEQAAGNRSPAFQPPGCRPRRHGDVGRANRQSAVVKGDLRVTRRGPGEDSGPSHLARHHDHGLRSLRRNVSQGVRTPACMAYRITLAKHSAGEGGRWGGGGGTL